MRSTNAWHLLTYLITNAARLSFLTSWNYGHLLLTSTDNIGQYFAEKNIY